MKILFWSMAAALVGCRFYAFRPFLDHPHLFRQADTAFYALGLYRGGMNPFLPTVGWLGRDGHVILEFPLTEWLSAAIYFVTGPTILVDRLVNLTAFVLSAWLLFKIVETVGSRVLASFVTLVYLAEPLGIYYSRAVHIDFTAVCLAHACLLAVLRFAERGGWRPWAAAALSAALAFMVKAPYVFYLACPALFFCVWRRVPARRTLAVVAVFACGVVVFGAWFAYVQAVNRQAPDLSIVPSYFRHVDRFAWYFGTLADRWTLAPWRTVIGNVYREIASTWWWLPVPLALVAYRRLRGYFAFVLVWSAATLVYLVIFLTLNAMHNYYQIPFMAPFALWLGAAAYAIWSSGDVASRAKRRMAAAVLIVGYAAASFAVAVHRFYRIDPLNLAIGRFVEAHTGDDDLVVMAYTEAAYADPSFLFYAHRFGWSVGHDEVSPAILEALRRQGARVVVTSTLWPPSDATRDYLDDRPLAGVFEATGGQVALHRLNPDSP